MDDCLYNGSFFFSALSLYCSFYSCLSYSSCRRWRICRQSIPSGTSPLARLCYWRSSEYRIYCSPFGCTPSCSMPIFKRHIISPHPASLFMLSVLHIIMSVLITLSDLIDSNVTRSLRKAHTFLICFLKSTVAWFHSATVLDQLEITLVSV